MPLRAPEFEAGASADSAIYAWEVSVRVERTWAFATWVAIRPLRPLGHDTIILIR